MQAVEKLTHTSNGNFHGKLSVTEDRKHGRNAGNSVRQDNCRAGVFSSLKSGEHENASTDHGADAKPYEIPPSKVFLHLMITSGLDLMELGRVQGSSQEPVLEPHGSFFQCSKIISNALKRFLRQEIVLRTAASTSPPPPHPLVISTVLMIQMSITATSHRRS